MRRNRPWVLLPLLLWAMLGLSATASAQSEPAGDAVGAVTAETEEDAKHPPRFLSANLVVTTLDEERGESRQRLTLRKYGNRVRTVAENQGDGQFVGDTLYHYDNREYFRKLVDEDITFVYRLVTRERIKAQIFGYMDKPEDEPFFRVQVNDNLEFDGHPCTLSLVGIPAGGRIHALHWVWEATDLDNAVVRVVFPESYTRIIIVEYFDAHDRPFDLSELELPEGTVVMTAF